MSIKVTDGHWTVWIICQTVQISLDLSGIARVSTIGERSQVNETAKQGKDPGRERAMSEAYRLAVSLVYR